ncbi:MAG: hypothetical protein H6838_06890 [Planctomycetes bacterium]|nr:hypothetical protein [Planctomycetota bacterium]
MKSVRRSAASVVRRPALGCWLAVAALLLRLLLPGLHDHGAHAHGHAHAHAGPAVACSCGHHHAQAPRGADRKDVPDAGEVEHEACGGCLACELEQFAPIVDVGAPTFAPLGFACVGTLRCPQGPLVIAQEQGTQHARAPPLAGDCMRRS